MTQKLLLPYSYELMMALAVKSGEVSVNAWGYNSRTYAVLPSVLYLRSFALVHYGKWTPQFQKSFRAEMFTGLYEQTVTEPEHVKM